jgi:hypothetical protein
MTRDLEVGSSMRPKGWLLPVEAQSGVSPAECRQRAATILEVSFETKF